MNKMSIADAAEHFGVSREAIHNRIRRGSLESVVEDGIKLVFVDASKSGRATVKSRVNSSKTQSSDSRYYKLLEEQNAKLQERVEKLEGETSSLRDQKEQMLIEERIKIEQIYKDRDEQLKNVLNTLSSQFMLSTPEVKNRVEVSDDTLEAEIESEVVLESEVISLKKYLKKNKISEKKSKKIKAKFKKEAERDNRIITIGKKHYINLAKYDYKNLLN
ncbi:MAG: DNA-binding protein [Campylobacterota bacterium]|nr:DNA-binding protein [Campylobacterota bacterium]